MVVGMLLLQQSTLCLGLLLTWICVSAVGAVVGMSMAIRGGDAVVWSAEQVSFPYLSGMSTIFMSWAISPIGKNCLRGFGVEVL